MLAMLVFFSTIDNNIAESAILLTMLPAMLQISQRFTFCPKMALDLALTSVHIEVSKW